VLEQTHGVEQSEEIRRVIERWTRAIAEGDIDCLARLSEHPGALIVGTDPAEWWRGTDTREVWGRQIEELRGVFSVQADEIDAWEEGTVGWAAVKETISVDGSPREARATYVLRLERGEWKVIQAHWSLPQEKIETFGRPLTMTIDELATIVQRDQPNLSEMLNPEGTVTIVFTDIVDSTVLLRRLGDQTWLEILQRHNAVIEETTAAHGGTVVETQGDGSMLAFPSARRAVACGQAIQSAIARAFAGHAPPITVRIGMHTGDALRQQEQFFGVTVHYAARVAGQARGGEVLVSSVVRDLVGDDVPNVSFLDGPEVELKGLEGRHRLYAATAA